MIATADAGKELVMEKLPRTDSLRMTGSVSQASRLFASTGFSTGSAPPPRVSGMPLFGSATSSLRNPERFLLDAQEHYGPVFKARLGFREYTVLTGEAGRTFVRKNQEARRGRGQFEERFAQELGIPCSFLSGSREGEWHGNLRQMMKLGFCREAAAPYVPQMAEAVLETARAWKTGQCISMMDTMALLTFRLYGFVLADRDLAARYPEAKRYARALMTIGARLGFQAVPKVFGGRRSRRAALTLMNDLFLEARGRRLSERRRLTILDALSRTLDEPRRTHTEMEVIVSALSGFVGTMVSVSRAVSFLFYELARNPEAMARATREADAAFAQGMPSAETLRRMTYLRAALLESLRLHPIALGQPIRAEKDFVFEGCHIRKGERVTISGVGPNVSEEHYRDPWKFDPERFLEPRHDPCDSEALYAPFGLGGWDCQATGLIETMAMAATAALLRTVAFELERPDYRMRVTLSGLNSDFRLCVRELRGSALSAEGLPPLRIEREDFGRASHVFSKLEVRSYAPGAVICYQGDVAEEFFIVVEGEVRRIKLRIKDVEEREEAQLGPGAFFGENGLMSDRPHDATVVCLEAPVKVLVMRRDQFLRTVTEADLLSSDIALLARLRS